jgi:hypothetical protein
MTIAKPIGLTVLAGLLWLLSTSLAPAAQDLSPHPIQDAPKLEDDRAKRSYAVGMNLGTALRRQAGDQSAELDVNVIVRGFKDAFACGTTLLNQAEMRVILNAFQAELKSTQALRLSEESGKATATSAISPQGSINVAFKLDQRITRALYMGDRWLPPPFTQRGDEKQVIVEAWAEAVNASGQRLNEAVEWIPADPTIATVASGQDNQVAITVLRPGQTSLRLVAGAISTELMLTAAHNKGALEAQLSQKE